MWSEEDERYLARRTEEIMRLNHIQPILDCWFCGAELAARMEVLMGPPLEITRLAYNCPRCWEMNVVWSAFEE